MPTQRNPLKEFIPEFRGNESACPLRERRADSGAYSLTHVVSEGKQTTCG